jgi:hypothetical protein
MTPQRVQVPTYVSQQDSIVKTMKGYVDGIQQGKSSLMQPSFHPSATFFGHYPGGTMAGSIQLLFDWIDKNGPAPNTQVRFAGVDILQTVAYVHLEVEDFSGSLAGAAVTMSDIFTLMLTGEDWKIVNKSFHWHM